MGVDNGNLTISGSGVSITLGVPGTPATLIFGSGNSITKTSGASLVKAAGSSINKTYIWMRDNDGDGWPASTTTAVGATAPSIDSQVSTQSKRRYTMNAGAWSAASQAITTTDCNDSASSFTNSCCSASMGQSCNCNVCGSCGGTIQCNGTCSGSTPGTPYLSTCSLCNSCGTCNSGTQNPCNGTGCTATYPPNPYSSTCTRCLACGACFSGTQNPCTGTGCNAQTSSSGVQVYGCQSNNLYYSDGRCYASACTCNVGANWDGGCTYGVSGNINSGCTCY